MISSGCTNSLAQKSLSSVIRLPHCTQILSQACDSQTKTWCRYCTGLYCIRIPVHTLRDRTESLGLRKETLHRSEQGNFVTRPPVFTRSPRSPFPLHKKTYFSYRLQGARVESICHAMISNCVVSITSVSHTVSMLVHLFCTFAFVNQTSNWLLWYCDVAMCSFVNFLSGCQHRERNTRSSGFTNLIGWPWKPDGGFFLRVMEKKTWKIFRNRLNRSTRNIISSSTALPPRPYRGFESRTFEINIGTKKQPLNIYTDQHHRRARENRKPDPSDGTEFALLPFGRETSLFFSTFSTFVWALSVKQIPSSGVCKSLQKFWPQECCVVELQMSRRSWASREHTGDEYAAQKLKTSTPVCFGVNVNWISDCQCKSVMIDWEAQFFSACFLENVLSAKVAKSLAFVNIFPWTGRSFCSSMNETGFPRSSVGVGSRQHLSMWSRSWADPTSALGLGEHKFPSPVVFLKQTTDNFVWTTTKISVSTPYVFKKRVQVQCANPTARDNGTDKDKVQSDK